ncbi:MAG: chemotaxis protein CheD [Bryobacteraceae bacterium]
MTERRPVLPDLNLQPGELYLARTPAILRTILGSCVSVTFWSKRLGAGALCHGVLPRCPLVWPVGANLSDGHRYVDFSIRYLAQQFDALGARRDEVEVKLFGGADVLPLLRERPDRPTVGSMNCQAAVEVLELEGFQVAASDLGGTRGRRIHFHTGTGVVLVYRLEASEATA